MKYFVKWKIKVKRVSACCLINYTKMRDWCMVLTKTKIIAKSLHKDHVLSYVLHEAYKETQISRKRWVFHLLARLNKMFYSVKLIRECAKTGSAACFLYYHGYVNYCVIDRWQRFLTSHRWKSRRALMYIEEYAFLFLSAFFCTMLGSSISRSSSSCPFRFAHSLMCTLRKLCGSN